MSSQIDFLSSQLSQIQADLDRYHRMLDGMRNAVVVNEKVCDAEAELRLLQDPVWNKVRRLEATARRSWLSFQRALTDLRKQEEKAQQASQPNEAKSARRQPPAAAQPAQTNGLPHGHAPQPHPYPKQ